MAVLEEGQRSHPPLRGPRCQRSRARYQRVGRQMAKVRIAMTSGISLRAGETLAATPAVRTSAEIRGAPELSIIVPTLIERENVELCFVKTLAISRLS
jgi:hypothetical protein